MLLLLLLPDNAMCLTRLADKGHHIVLDLGLAEKQSVGMLDVAVADANRVQVEHGLEYLLDREL